MNEVALVEHRALTVADVKGQVQLIQQVMEAVMKKGVHYDTIPGTDKPSLLKPGAEKLMSTFRIAVDPQVEDLSGPDEIRYRVRCVGTHQTSGIVMGTGVGECSSGEEKYRWRRAVCDAEFDNTPEERRRTKFGRGKQNSHYTVQQVRVEPADVANTILKMAKKRALVDFTLTALAASDIFAQDLEDMPEEVREAVTEQQPQTVSQPKARSESEQAVNPATKINEGQVTFLQKKLAAGNVNAADFCKHFGIASVPDLPFGKVNDALKWIAENDKSE
jgi:hypothetical protein